MHLLKELFLFGVFFFYIISFSVQAGENGTVALDSLVEEGVKNNPEVQAAYNNWEAAFYKVKQVKSLPDPMAGVSFFGEHIETKLGPQERKYTASQKVPFPGKLDLKGTAQSKHADMLKEKYEAVKILLD